MGNPTLKKKKNIFLIGFMGVGKSTMARKLANKLNYEFIDTDKYIEQKYQTSIEDIIYSSGIDVFRKIEHNVLKEVVLKNKCVIATGGGMPCYFNNIDLINQNGFSVYICFPVDVIFYRLKNAKTPRPLIKNLDDVKLKEFIIKNLTEREIYYNQADLIIKERCVRTEVLLNLVLPLLSK